MKFNTTIAFGLAALGLVSARAQDVKFNVPGQQSDAAAPAAPAKPTFTDAQVAEEIGWVQGKNMGLSELGFSKAEVQALIKGLEAAADGKEAPYQIEQIGPMAQQFMQKKQQAYLAGLKAKNVAYIAKVKAENKNVQETPSGLLYEIVQPGTGDKPKPEDTVKVHYTGKLIDGTVFDSSVERNQPAEFKLNEVVPGWTEGLQKISKGGKIKLYVPPQLGYGEEARPGIPPSSVLVFDVELLDITPASAAPATPAASATPAPAAPVSK
jgi:FKBP-type peptidyl-prolyl cis-trans isomerase